jgi:hypothetical protein
MEDEGSESRVTQYAWISDGPVRPVESGLPRNPYNTERSRSTLIRFIVDRPYVKEFNHRYSALAARHPEYDLADPDMMSHYEKQLIAQHAADTAATRSVDLNFRVPGTQQKSTKIPLDAHLHTWGGAIPYLETEIFPEDEMDVAERRPPRIRRSTGISGPMDTSAPNMVGIIRPLRFRSLPKAEAHDRALSRDDPTQPLIFQPPGKRFLSAVKTTADATVEQCVKRFFDPDVGIPFVPADVAKYFPLELLLPQEASPESEDDVAADEEAEPGTTLLDTSDQDVLFTKNKAPFTRADVSAARAFTRHWDHLKERQRVRADRALAARDRTVREAFHGRTVFKTYLELLEEDCKRIRSGVIGKSPYKGKSLWEVAAERAPNDHSGLAERREFWWRFAAFVRFIGGIVEDLEKDVVRRLRVKLMVRHPVTAALFWEVARELPAPALESVPALRLIEFTRMLLDVGQPEFGLFLDERNISHMIYNQTILSNMSREYVDKLNQIAKGPIDVPAAD